MEVGLLGQTTQKGLKKFDKIIYATHKDTK